ncbi:hypothetical protein WIS52_19095 [Pseudonocardia nematodicida]|uniref:Uncharacterized protein n=1 Tax=Pseudonocardia nematodicida TaxID=1206997 RepID=A0ABV1KDP4_9PSEU
MTTTTETTTTETTSADTIDDTGTVMATAAAELGVIAEIIERGAVRGARARLARLLDSVDAPTRLLMVRCVDALEAEHPTTMLHRLRHEWRHADEDGRALVQACAPIAERSAEKARDAARIAQDNRVKDRSWEARRARNLTSRRDTPRRRRDPRTVESDTVAQRYFAERVEPSTDEDEPQRDDRIDYDRAALAPMAGLGCVACGVERSATDRRRANDDGLCQDCREDGLPAIAIPSADADARAVLFARCDYIAATSTSPAERDARMRRDWRAMRRSDQFAVVDWREARGV